MLVLDSAANKDDAIEQMRKRKTFMGILATKAMETQRYSPAYVIFTSPDVEGKKINITLHRSNGATSFAGVRRSLVKIRVRFACGSRQPVPWSNSWQRRR